MTSALESCAHFVHGDCRALDERLAIPYLGFMATRLLLTLLALLTGLAAQFTPAQARDCAPANTEIGTLALARAVQPCVALARLERPAVALDRVGPEGQDLTGSRYKAVVISAVLQGIDRARE